VCAQAKDLRVLVTVWEKLKRDAICCSPFPCVACALPKTLHLTRLVFAAPPFRVRYGRRAGRQERHRG